MRATPTQKDLARQLRAKLAAAQYRPQDELFTMLVRTLSLRMDPTYHAWRLARAVIARAAGTTTHPL
jgi:hypothetical protein